MIAMVYDPQRDRPRKRSSVENSSVVDRLLDPADDQEPLAESSNTSGYETSTPPSSETRSFAASIRERKPGTANSRIQRLSLPVWTLAAASTVTILVALRLLYKLRKRGCA